MYLGEVKLKRTMVIIYTSKELCLRCCKNDCIHYQGYEQCLLNEHLIIYQPRNVNTAKLFQISSSLIFLIDTKEFQIFRRMDTKWFCDSCSFKCSKSACMKHLLPNDEPNEPTAVQKEIQYSVISYLLIPASFDENMINVYEDQQLHNNLNLPTELLPEKELCEYKYTFSKETITLERKGLILYTAKAVVYLSEHRGKIMSYNLSIAKIVKLFRLVYSSMCDGPCKCRTYFDGTSRLLLNINNRYLIHFDLLYSIASS